MIEINGKEFTTWQDIESELFTPEEIAECKLNVALIGELTNSQTKQVETPKERIT